jgi:hypothetical protein
MTDSLIAGTYELIGATTNPEYRLAPGWDFGEGAPDTVPQSPAGAVAPVAALAGESRVGPWEGDGPDSPPIPVRPVSTTAPAACAAGATCTTTGATP